METELTTTSTPVTEPEQYRNSTYLIVSKMAYLLGVPKGIFDNPHEPPKPEYYDELEQNKSARIIRNLCIIRTGLERHFKKIQTAMTYDLKNIDTLPEYIPPQCAKQLWRDGVELLKANYKPEKYIEDINRLLTARINECKSLFPIWLKWDYIRELFLMPQGTTPAGAKRAFSEYHENRAKYPYQVYLNWSFGDRDGNILYSDKKFVTLLYEKHEDFFQDVSKVSDASDLTKQGIYGFLAQSQKTVFVVDCENSDPYKLHAVLKNLDAEQLSKVSKIILYDDVHTTVAWQILQEFTTIPVERILVERVKQSKSLVDMSLAVGVCKEFYQTEADSFVIVSSDSDYWALISALPNAKFLVMVEEELCGRDLIAAMNNAGIFYCYIDDFCTGNSEGVKLRTLLTQIQSRLDAAVHLNLTEMLRQVYLETMVDMTEGEKKQFYDRYIKPMRIVVDADGNLSLKLAD
jgi:hypothetical protein